METTKLAFNPAVALSYLNPADQAIVQETMEREETAPSLSQAQKLKKMASDGTIDDKKIVEVLTVQKPMYETTGPRLPDSIHTLRAHSYPFPPGFLSYWMLSHSSTSLDIQPWTFSSTSLRIIWWFLPIDECLLYVLLCSRRKRRLYVVTSYAPQLSFSWSFVSTKGMTNPWFKGCIRVSAFGRLVL